MDTKEITIQFENVDLQNAGKYAHELEEYLKNEVEDLQIVRRKERTDTLDFGATLVLVLGTPAILALARGIADWLRRRPNAEIIVDCGGGKKVNFKGNSEDVGKIGDFLKGMCS